MKNLSKKYKRFYDEEVYFLEHATLVDDTRELSMAILKGEVRPNSGVGEEVYFNGLCVNNITGANIAACSVFGGYGGK
ncbi:MAG: hypothetical protein IKL48_00990 [Elusimicrobiaceae bacterium]|nr:hypothetical protein [Elusimicrobiaceae bacterium]